MAKYDNCKILSPDGSFLGYCNQRRLDMYIKKNLGSLVEDKTVQLNYEPKIRDLDDFTRKMNNPYYFEPLKSQCVVCSSANHLIFFHLIPKDYRKWFPENKKTHNNKDVMLLCEKCHQYYGYYLNKLRDDFLRVYNIKLDQNLKTVRNYAKKLLLHDFNEDHRYFAKITEHLGHKPTHEDLEKLSNLSPYIGINECSSPCEYIVKRYISKDKITDFEEIWRNYFVEVMEPKFLPEGWVETK